MANWLTKGPRQFGEGNDSQQCHMENQVAT